MDVMLRISTLVSCSGSNVSERLRSCDRGALLYFSRADKVDERFDKLKCGGHGAPLA